MTDNKEGSKFNFNGNTFGDSNIFLGENNSATFKKITIFVNGEKVVDNEEVTLKLSNRVLNINRKNEK